MNPASLFSDSGYAGRNIYVTFMVISLPRVSADLMISRCLHFLRSCQSLEYVLNSIYKRTFLCIYLHSDTTATCSQLMGRSTVYLVTVQVRLVKSDVELLDDIVQNKTGVTRGSRAGALRQLIRQWSSLYNGVAELQASNDKFSQDNKHLNKLIAAHSLSSQAMHEHLSKEPGRKFWDKDSEPEID